MSIAIPLIILVMFMVIGMPIGFAMAISGSIGVIINSSIDSLFGILSTSPYRTAANWLLTTIPMFILMGEIASSGNIVRELFNTINRWIGHIPGGMAVASILASAGFGAVSGSSTAATAAMANTVTKEMRKFGYEDGVAGGSVAAGGTIAILIPPSIPLVLYGILTESSIGQLLIAGIIPGILTTITFALLTWWRGKKEPEAYPLQKSFTWGERFKSLKDLWAILLLFLGILVVIYTGISTVTEAAALGALFALIITVLAKRIKGQDFKKALNETARTTSMIFTIIIGATIFGYFITMTQLSQQIINYVGGLPIPPLVILLIILIIYIILGFFMDQIAILILTLPIVFPLMDDLNFNAIWLGILITKTVEIGMLTPPMGINVFVASTVAGIDVKNIFKRIWPYVMMDLVNLSILVAFPALSLWLVNMMP